MDSLQRNVTSDSFLLVKNFRQEHFALASFTWRFSSLQASETVTIVETELMAFLLLAGINETSNVLIT